jgi:hypothetical protein
MACKKYESSVADVALGQLFRPSRRSQLAAHLGICESCRKAHERAEAARLLTDQVVNALVRGEPSSQFAARLRARIANESVPTPSPWAARVPVVLSALIFAAIVGITATNWIERDAARGPLPVVASIPPAPVTDAPAATRSAVAEQRTASRRVPRRQAARERTPDVLVAPGQMQALLRLAEVTRHGRVGYAIEVGRHDQVGQPLEVTPIEIQPLDVSKIEDFDSSGGF